MYNTELIFVLCFALVCSHRHVIRSTPKLEEQGYHGDIDLGEVIAEAMVNSPRKCGMLCKEISACRSAMLMGQLCRMFGLTACQCSDELTYITDPSRYMIGKADETMTFHKAMEKCISMRAHLVHIDAKEEHDLIKDYIRRHNDDSDEDFDCDFVMTGGRTDNKGSKEMSDWRWYFDKDFAGPLKPSTYLGWADHQPNDATGNQYYISLNGGMGYDFDDLDNDHTKPNGCYICECP